MRRGLRREDLFRGEPPKKGCLLREGVCLGKLA